MPSAREDIGKRIKYFVRDSISFLIYLFIFWKKRKVALVYHSVGIVDRAKDIYRLNITPEMFEEHLKVISKLKDGVKITFDDGYGNNYEQALPLLKRYGLEAIIFLITDFIDGKIGSQAFCGKDLELKPLAWAQIKAMDAEGIRFGSHSVSHPMLSELSEDDARRELSESKKRIESELGHPVESLAYPFGGSRSFNAQVEKIASEAGYGNAYSNIMGADTGAIKDNYRLRRVRIYSEDSNLKLKMKIAGAYDWVDLSFR